MDYGKKSFVEDIGAAFALHDEQLEIDYMEYDRDKDGFEAVTIYFEGGGHKTINVTGDSCVGILKDIARALS